MDQTYDHDQWRKRYNVQAWMRFPDEKERQGLQKSALEEDNIQKNATLLFKVKKNVNKCGNTVSKNVRTHTRSTSSKKGEFVFPFYHKDE